jgi:prevent-host-death family protein
MMTTVTIDQAKADLAQLIASVETGEDVIILRGEEPVVKLQLVPKKHGKRSYGSYEGLMEIPDDAAFAPMTDEELDEWGLL